MFIPLNVHSFIEPEIHCLIHATNICSGSNLWKTPWPTELDHEEPRAALMEVYK